MRTLTVRQREILYWVAMGKTNAEIAQILGLTLGTVKNHVAKLVRRFGVNSSNSRLMLAVFAIVNGDLDEEFVERLRAAATSASTPPAKETSHRILQF